MSAEVQAAPSSISALSIDEDLRLDGDGISLTKYQAVNSDWRDLVENAPSAGLYHREPWLSILRRSYGLDFWLVTAYRQRHITAGAIFAKSKKLFSRHLIGLSFSDYCPPLALETADAQLMLLNLAREHSSQSYEIRGYAAPAPWTKVDRFVDWTLPLGPLKELHVRLDSNFRRNLRRASSSKIDVENGAELKQMRRFYAMQLETRRRFGLPPQPWRFFRAVQEVYAPRGDLEIWLAATQGRDLAGAVFIRDGTKVHYKWGARRIRTAESDNGANHLLFWKAIEHFATVADELRLGRTDIRNHGLMRFKHGLGARSVPLPYSYFPRVTAEPSAEILTGRRKLAAAVWRQLPLPVTRIIGGALYRFLG